jgi:hypothetical protein
LTVFHDPPVAVAKTAGLLSNTAKSSMRPAGEADPISRNRNPAKGEFEPDSPSCVNPTGDNKKDNKRIEGKPRVRITKRVSGIAFLLIRLGYSMKSTEG